MCAVDVPWAHAGSWSIEPASQIPWSDPNRQTEVAKRYNGEFEVQTEGFPHMSWFGPHYDSYSQPMAYENEVHPFQGNDYSTNQGGVLWNGGLGALPEGGKGSIKAQGTVGVVLRYSPDMMNPNDKPEKPIYLRVVVSPSIYAEDGDSYSQNNDPSKEYVTFDAEPMGDVVGDSSTIQQRFEPIDYAGKTLEGRRTFYLRFDPANKGEVDEYGDIRFVVPLVNITNAEAKLDGDRKTFRSHMNASEWNYGRVEVRISVESNLTPYALSIASSLGPTYRKVTDAGQLPTYTNPNTGSVGVNTNRIRPQTPYNGSGSGPWGLLNEYSVADSVVTWNQDLLAWTGGGNFHSVESGFTAPLTRTWTVNGNGPISPVVSNQVANGYNPLNGFYWNLGGDSAGKHITRSSGLTVEVDDSSGVDPLTSTYSINWHPSLDDVAEDSKRTKTTVTSIGDYVPITTQGGAVVTALGPTQSGTFTQDLGQVGAKAGAESMELIANIGAGIVSTAPGVGTALASVFTFAGYQFGQVAEPQPENIGADYNAWRNAVNTQRGLNDSGQYVGPPDVQRLWPESMGDATLTDATTDKNFLGSTMTLRIRTDKITTPIVGDSYDSQGYAGPLVGEYTKPVRFKIYTFTSSIDNG